MLGIGLLTGIIATMIGIIAIFLFASFGAIIGAISGGIITIIPFLGVSVKEGFTQVFGISNPNLVSIGSMLGFIAGFFKSVTNNKKDK